MRFYILAAEVFVRLLLTTIAFVSCCLCESCVRVGLPRGEVTERYEDQDEGKGRCGA